jgi:GAF domain-containing protein
MTKRGQAKRKAPVTRKPASSLPDLKKEVAALKHELAESNQREAATADVLSVISRSGFDLQRVLDTLVESAARLCGADQAAISRQQGAFFWYVAQYGHASDVWQSFKSQPIEITRGSLIGRAIIDRDIVHVHDCLADPEFSALVKGIHTRTGARTGLAVPLLREGNPIGVLVLLRRSVKPFTGKQIELVTTFANQAVIAIENARLLDEVQARTKELTESLEHQTATSEVLQVISSSQGDLQPVFETMLERATRICDAKFATLYLCEADGFRAVAATHDAPPAYVEARKREPRLQPPPDGPLGRVTSTKQVAHIADVSKLQSYLDRHPFLVAAVELGGFRTALSVPMLKDNVLVGAITISRQEVRPFTDKQIKIVDNFAAQAVIAIENTRLLQELRQRTDDLSEALEQQTATSEVLQVISSSPGELAPVFATILESAVRICGAKFGNLWLREGDAFRIGATHDAPAEYAEFLRREQVFRPDPRVGLGVAVRTKKSYQIADVAAEPTHMTGQAFIELAGARTLIGVPMLKDDEVVGAIGIYRQEVRPFTDKQIELVENFAKQAVIAIENARLLKELRQRTTDLTESLEQQTATSEVLKVISSSPGDLKPVFEAMLDRAMQLCEAAFGGMWTLERDRYTAVALQGIPQPYAAFLVSDGGRLRR